MRLFGRKGRGSVPETEQIGHDICGDDRDDRIRVLLNDCPIRIRRQQDLLQQLSGGTEGEFLAIGSRLHDFYSRAVEIGQTSACLVDEVGGAALVESIGGLQSLTDKMTRLLTLMEAEAKRCREILQKTLQLTARVNEPLAGFRKIMKVLHVLGISTKIESARLSQLGTGFYSLANDVEKLAVLIHEKSTKILEENGSLSGRVNEILSRVINNENTQYEHVSMALEKTYASLAAINVLRGRYANVAHAISSASDMVSRNISAVVTSMQFHDITRQQIEHVSEALGYLLQLLEGGTDTSDEAEGTRVVTEVANICRLQAAQLGHARAELVSAVQSIVGNLAEIMDNQQLIAHEASGMRCATGSSGDTLFTDIERCLGIVAEVVIDSAETTRKLSDAVTSVAQTIGTISGFVEDIENIGEEINLIAINSQIRAAHTGTEGAALGVLAEAIQRLSVDACHQTVAVSETLREVSQVTNELCNTDDHDFMQIEAETENLSHDIGKLVGLLCGMNDKLCGNLTGSDEAVRDLVADIGTASSGISIHETVGRGIEQVVSELDAIVEQVREIVPDLPAVDMSRLHEGYTMQSERHVHASVAGMAADGADSVPMLDASIGGAGRDELGDNVELF